MAGLLLLWLVMEEVCPSLRERYVVMLSNNSPTVYWARRLALRHSLVAAQLVCPLTLRIKAASTSPLISLHISGNKNGLTDMPSRLFGSKIRWRCCNNANSLTLFNRKFPVPKTALVDSLPPELCYHYKTYLRIANEAYFAGRVDATTRGWLTHFSNWYTYIWPLGVDPHLQGVPYRTWVRLITGFKAQV